jgi:hypothetical protein
MENGAMPLGRLITNSSGVDNRLSTTTSKVRRGQYLPITGVSTRNIPYTLEVQTESTRIPTPLVSKPRVIQFDEQITAKYRGRLKLADMS